MVLITDTHVSHIAHSLVLMNIHTVYNYTPTLHPCFLIFIKIIYSSLSKSVLVESG